MAQLFFPNMIHSAWSDVIHLSLLLQLKQVLLWAAANSLSPQREWRDPIASLPISKRNILQASLVVYCRDKCHILRFFIGRTCFVFFALVLLFSFAPFPFTLLLFFSFFSHNCYVHHLHSHFSSPLYVRLYFCWWFLHSWNSYRLGPHVHIYFWGSEDPVHTFWRVEKSPEILFQDSWIPP